MVAVKKNRQTDLALMNYLTMIGSKIFLIEKFKNDK
jgi:hypothetical protein